MRLRIHPDPILNQEATPGIPGPAMIDLFKGMEEVMDLEGGIGIAAPQVGESVRACLVKTESKGTLRMLNPKIVSRSGINVATDERCLSVPGLSRRRLRSWSVKVRYQDPFGGAWSTVHLKEMEAACFQHEFDHLNGKTIAES